VIGTVLVARNKKYPEVNHKLTSQFYAENVIYKHNTT